MLQFAPGSPPSTPVVAGLDRVALLDPILSFAGTVTASHALVISHNGLDLMCRLLRGGCAAVTTAHPSVHGSPSVQGDRGVFDLVVVWSNVSTGTTSQLVQQAKRALLPGGRFLAVVPAISMAANPSAPAMLMRLLKADGFNGAQTRATQDGLLVRADLPIGGAIQAMPNASPMQP